MKLSPGLQTLLTLLPALTAALYLIGFCYYQGYLGAYGVDESIFPLASDKALLNGFFSLFILTIPVSVYAFGAIGLFMILVVVLAVLSSTNRVRNVTARIKSWILLNPEPLESPLAEDLLNKSYAVYGYCAGLFIILLVLFGLAYSSDKNGRNQAEREMKTFLSGGGVRVKVFHSQSIEPYSGKLVLCGGIFCAFWSASGALILRNELVDKLETNVTSAKKK